ncbi:MAG: LUD domain-containing protein [Gemmatimonadaceae bacterium]
MTARDAMLSAIRAAGVPAAPPAPSVAVHPPHEEGDGLLAQFLRVLAEVGGEGVVRDAGQPLDDLLDRVLGEARTKAMVIRARFAVAENAAVYVDAADLAARNDIVREEHLVLIVPYGAIVPTMHEAVRLMPTGAGCGWFLSGPSKTADIEQSLVFGAQGSRTHRVVFDRG